MNCSQNKPQFVRFSGSGPNPTQLSGTDAAMPMGYALHPEVGRQSWRPPQRKGIFFLSDIGDAFQLQQCGSWIGLADNVVLNQKKNVPSSSLCVQGERGSVQA